MNQSTTEIASGAVRDIDGSVMKKIGAMASSVVVTTFTDVGCLLVFLGLAAVLI